MPDFMATLIWLPVLCGIIYSAALLAFVAGDMRNRRRSRRLSGKGPFEGGCGTESISSPVVSVIVPARNEQESIGPCLKSIRACDWPDNALEIIVVDDHSSDATPHVVRHLAAERDEGATIQLLQMGSGAAAEAGAGSVSPEHRNAAYSAPPGSERDAQARRIPDRGHKKRALQRAVRAARGDYVLVTDADSLVPKSWIRRMSEHFEPGVGFVAGPVRYGHSKGVMGRVLALEFAGLQGIVSGAIGLGRPILSSGASIAYRRDVFEEVGGYRGIDHVSSGDDVLLMQRIAYESDWDVRYCASREAIVRTQAPASLRDFLRQRRRWTTNTPHYRPGLVAFNVMIYAFFASLLLYGFGAIVWPAVRAPFLTGLAVKLVGEGTMLLVAASFYQMLHNLLLYIPAQPFQIGYILWAGIMGLRGGLSWKDRQLER